MTSTAHPAYRFHINVTTSLGNHRSAGSNTREYVVAPNNFSGFTFRGTVGEVLLPIREGRTGKCYSFGQSVKYLRCKVDLYITNIDRLMLEGTLYTYKSLDCYMLSLQPWHPTFLSRVLHVIQDKGLGALPSARAQCRRCARRTGYRGHLFEGRVP